MKYSLKDEMVSQSQYSPGPVQDEEYLLRGGFHPEHTKNGQVIETAIRSDDLKCRGFSVDRLAYAKREIIENRIQEQQSKLPAQREEPFFARFKCGGIRRVVYGDGDRAFIVIDTAGKDNIAHASLYSARPSRRTRRAAACAAARN